MAELPNGTVTFLFTDIEGSTGLVKQLRANENLRESAASRPAEPMRWTGSAVVR
jgi:class 3 adenylate cyclase